MIGGFKTNYTETGAGYPIVLIHGLSDNLTVWSSIIPRLARQNRVVALDLRGHGESDKPDMPYSVQLFSRDVLNLLQQLKIPKAHMIGLSLGAAITLQLALDQPQLVRTLSLLSSFSYSDSAFRHNMEMLREKIISGGIPAFFDAAITLVLTPEFITANERSIPEIRKECIRVNSPTSIIHAIDACMNFDIRDRTSQIVQPTLVVSGSQDIFTPTYFSEQIHRAVKNSELRIMSDVGHNLLIPSKISELTDLIQEFIQHN